MRSRRTCPRSRITSALWESFPALVMNPAANCGEDCVKVRSVVRFICHAWRDDIDVVAAVTAIAFLKSRHRIGPPLPAMATNNRSGAHVGKLHSRAACHGGPDVLMLIKLTCELFIATVERPMTPIA
jgi:hypothetical protein